LRVDLARCHLFRGEGAAARALVKRAIEDLDGLPEDGPQVATRARAVSLLGTLRHAAGDVEGAVLAYREATGALDRLVLAFPRVLLYREHRAATASNLGMALDDACGVGLPCAHAEARAAIRRALTDQSLLVREHPAIPRLRVEMARTHQNLARSLIQGVHGPRTAEEREEAEATLREGLALLDEIDHPRNGVSERAALASTLGVHLASAGRAEEAEVFHGAAVRALEALVRLDPDKAPLQGELAAHLCNQAQALLDGQDPAAALPLVDRALGHLQVARDRSPENPTWQRFEHNVHWTRGRACIRLGRHGDAAAAAEAIAGSAQTVAALDLALDLIRGAHRVAATEEGGFRGPAALYLERQRSLEAARHLAATASPPR
jgi:tetratricopeptide (TPR) repeat protein